MLSFGYNSFWNFMHGSPAVQELLNKPDLKVEDLLEEDGLLLELKTLNQKLVNFILREENLKELISYVISEPDAEEAITNQKKAYKYPFVCADVLSSDCQAIVAEFFKTKQDLNEMSAIHKAEDAEDQDEVNTDDDMVEKAEPITETTAASTEESKTEDTTQDETEKKDNANSNELPYLDYLFTFLDCKEMNLTSAGYFAKIVNNLFSKKPSALLTYLYEIKPVLLEKMIDHISSKSIAEFVAKILTFESSLLVNSEDEIYNTRRNDILKLAIKKLDPKSDIEEINNTAYLICEVLGKYNTMHCSQEILQNLLEKSTIDYFFEILKSHDSTSCCAVGLILGNIFAYYILINSPKQQNSDENETVNEPQRFELTEEIPLVQAFIDNLQDIVQYVCNTSGTTFTSQYGAQVTPFGSARLKIVELIIIALKANNEAIYTKLVEYKFIEGLLNLFVKYEWNNLLHNQVEKIISLFLESNYDNLKTILFERVKLLNFVIDVCRDSEYTLPGPHERKIVKGYNGQITNFANKLANSKDPIVIKYIEEHENWKDFVETTLDEINKKNETRLGGRDPRQAEEDDMGDVQLQLPGMMQKFSKYFNPSGKNQSKDDDDEEDEDQNDDDLNKAQDEDEEDNDDDEEEDTRKGYESLFPDHESKHIIRIDSNNHEVASRGRTSFGYPNHHDDDDEEEEEQRDEHENIQSMNGPQIINETLKTEETVLDPDFTSNTMWKKIDWHTADDILKELELN